MKYVFWLTILLFGLNSNVWADPPEKVAEKQSGSKVQQFVDSVKSDAKKFFSSSKSDEPPGLAKKDDMPHGLAKKDKTPPGWDKGKKEGWDKANKSDNSKSSVEGFFKGLFFNDKRD